MEQAVEASRQAVEGRLADAYGRVHRGLQPSTCTERARQHLASAWQGDERFAWCDAKDVVLPRLREEVQRRWKIALSERDLIGSFAPDEVPQDMREACVALAAFALDPV